MQINEVCHAGTPDLVCVSVYRVCAGDVAFLIDLSLLSEEVGAPSPWAGFAGCSAQRRSLTAFGMAKKRKFWRHSFYNCHTIRNDIC